MREHYSVFLLFLLLQILVITVSGEIQIDSFSEKEIECLKDEKVFYKYDKNCYDLKKKGPCDDGQWLVLNKTRITRTKHVESKEILEPVCQDAPCEGSLIYWEKTRSCIKQRDKEQVCGEREGIVLANNIFGEGECICKKDHATLKNMENGSCYPLYHRGPCPLGMVFGFAGNDTEEAECIPDECYVETLKRKREYTMNKNGVLAVWDDGECYELGTTGPCPATAIFKVHSTLRRPACISPTNQIFQFERPQNCYGDEKGQCQQVIKIKNKEETAEKYMNELFQSVNNLRKRRWIGGKKGNKRSKLH